MIWDVAAGIAIVKAAGGKVDFSPGKLDNSLVVKLQITFYNQRKRKKSE